MRTPHGNPSTMAFLGVRNKSSGAAFREQLEVEEEYVGTSRSHHEAWMVNLGKGDEAWLSGPRDGEWFTGKAPSVCPGE